MALAPLDWTPPVEGPLLALLTLCASFAIYLAVRRVAWLRPLFGLGARAAAPAAPAAALWAAHGSAR
jgi:EamA domain-containing membrane protein RarD